MRSAIVVVLLASLASLPAAQGGVLQLQPTGVAPGDDFGRAVAVDGKTAIVGAPKDDVLGLDAGAAYVFDLVHVSRQLRLYAADGEGGDRFGSSVALDGSKALVGAPGNDADGADSGAAYVFDTRSGKPLARLLPEDGAPGASFGVAVGIEGEHAIVGAPGRGNFGAAYLFDLERGVQIAKLRPDNVGLFGGEFGISVAMSGGLAVVGAARERVVYVFDVATGLQREKLGPGGGYAFSRFGASVAIDGRLVAVGAPRESRSSSTCSEFGGEDFDVGAVYVFDSSTGDLREVHQSDAFDCATFFGQSVAAQGRSVAGATAFRQFVVLYGAHAFGDALAGVELEPGDAFGASVALGERALVVGAPGDDAGAGSVYVWISASVALR